MVFISRVFIVRCLFATLLVVCASCAERSSCTLDLPVYNAFGERIEFTITAVTPTDKPDANLLRLRPKEVRRLSNSQLDLDRSILGRMISVTLTNRTGTKITESVPFMQCQQRTSFRVGRSEAYGDTAGETIKGRLTGCQFTGDWWIRATNMFGVDVPRGPIETRVEQDGSFSLIGPMAGERHVIVIGKDKTPLAVFGTNVTEAGQNDLGTLDMSGRCQ